MKGKLRTEKQKGLQNRHKMIKFIISLPHLSGGQGTTPETAERESEHARIRTGKDRIYDAAERTGTGRSRIHGAAGRILPGIRGAGLSAAAGGHRELYSPDPLQPGIPEPGLSAAPADRIHAAADGIHGAGQLRTPERIHHADGKRSLPERICPAGRLSAPDGKLSESGGGLSGRHAEHARGDTRFPREHPWADTRPRAADSSRAATWADITPTARWAGRPRARFRTRSP